MCCFTTRYNWFTNSKKKCFFFRNHFPTIRNGSIFYGKILCGLALRSPDGIMRFILRRAGRKKERNLFGRHESEVFFYQNHVLPGFYFVFPCRFSTCLFTIFPDKFGLFICYRFIVRKLYYYDVLKYLAKRTIIWRSNLECQLYL